ncbi:MAG: hypothetical protein ACOC1O_00300 [bacterium]
MSHFTVMVIGENIEELLAPYQENNMGTCPKEYLEFFNVEEQERDIYKENYETKMSFDEFMTKHCGYEYDAEQGAYGYWENPNKKWDWYQLGGRWNGYFKLKKGAIGKRGSASFLYHSSGDISYADSCLKGDIDVEGMRKEAEEKALKKYDAVHSALSEIDLSKHISWKEFIEKKKAGKITIEEARRLYNNQDSVETFKEFSNSEEGSKYIDFSSNIEDFLIPREEYAKQAREGAISTFAVVNKDGWFEKGEMGWWGIVSDLKDQDDWNKQFTKMFDELPDDTVINLVDCHI